MRRVKRHGLELRERGFPQRKDAKRSAPHKTSLNGIDNKNVETLKAIEWDINWAFWSATASSEVSVFDVAEHFQSHCFPLFHHIPCHLYPKVRPTLLRTNPSLVVNCARFLSSKSDCPMYCCPSWMSCSSLETPSLSNTDREPPPRR